MISVESLGKRHDGADDILRGADLVLDLSDKLHDPNVAGSPLQHMTGLDDEVYDHVMRTPGARTLFTEVTEKALKMYWAGHTDLRVVFACRGGRHRSVVAARAAARWIALWGVPVTLTHHHVRREVLPPAA
jgi:UPF0042 nucleotide-binding protein